MAELHPLEIKLLQALKEDRRMSFDEIKAKAGISEDSVSRAALWLSSKNFAKIERRQTTIVQLGPEGRRFLTQGFPERVLTRSVLKTGGKSPIDKVSRISGLSEKDVKIALGWAQRKTWIRFVKEEGRTALTVETEPDVGPDERLIEALSKGPLIVEELDHELAAGLSILKRRPHALALTEKTDRSVILTKKGLEAAKKIAGGTEEASQLTPELIQTGDWRKVRLRKYDIKAQVLAMWPGKKQPYKRFLDELKWKLVALGFKEMKGPIVELMFFNCDALYMPQDHPAREIHDIYHIKRPRRGDLMQYRKFVENVKKTHQDGWITGSVGWNGKFSIQEAMSLVLRSQGTALSARTLISKELEIPGKYYSISRCYRPDVVDKSHLTEFNQIEGIVGGKELTFRDLLGVLEKFAIEVAEADEVRFRPDYFPFTEPSVEVSAYKKGYGWVEFGGAGLFRPEVCIPLGISVPVIAWGLGVDRLFMMKAGIDDIRTLFTYDLNWLRRQELT